MPLCCKIILKCCPTYGRLIYCQDTQVHSIYLPFTFRPDRLEWVFIRICHLKCIQFPFRPSLLPLQLCPMAIYVLDFHSASWILSHLELNTLPTLISKPYFYIAHFYLTFFASVSENWPSHWRPERLCEKLEPVLNWQKERAPGERVDYFFAYILGNHSKE